MIKHPKKRTERGNFETLKHRIRQGFKNNCLHLAVFFANLFSFGIMIAIIFKLLSTLTRIS